MYDSFHHYLVLRDQCVNHHHLLIVNHHHQHHHHHHHHHVVIMWQLSGDYNIWFLLFWRSQKDSWMSNTLGISRVKESRKQSLVSLTLRSIWLSFENDLLLIIMWWCDDDVIVIDNYRVIMSLYVSTKLWAVPFISVYLSQEMSR